jgi:glucosamine-6-phosphate deaminase
VKYSHLLVEADYDAMSRAAAALIDAAIRRRPESVLALPTGATPIGTYAELVRLHQETGTDWSQVTTFNLDEYAGIAPEHPQSYAAFMRTHLFGRVNLRPERTHLPDGLAADPAAEVLRYEAAVDAAGGIDLAVLGIGTNGHLGFNEPGPVLTAATHLAELSEGTWRRNFPELARSLDEQSWHLRPFQHAYTMGMGTILQARRIVLLASGVAKRAVLHAAVRGPVSTNNPASLLQLHPDVTLVLDRAAAGALHPAA